MTEDQHVLPPPADRRGSGRWPGLAVLALVAQLVLLGAPADPARADPSPARAVPAGEPLVILAETGATRNGVPVLRRHPHPEPLLRLLSRGFSGRLLRLYQRHTPTPRIGPP